MSFKLEVRNLKAFRDGMERLVRDMHGEPMLEAMRDATLYVTADARRDAPVDTGRLRASIFPEVRAEGRQVIGVVGSNVEHAPFMEFGTRPHWPPRQPIETWARRHGLSWFVVARSIARKGIKARAYLRGAIRKNAGRIVERLKRGVDQAAKGV